MRERRTVDDVEGAHDVVAVVEVHERVFLDRQVTADPQIKTTDLSCKSTDRLLVQSFTLTVVIYYYYSAQKLKLILP